jgi:polyhydroxybutyrate depolymerase
MSPTPQPAVTRLRRAAAFASLLTAITLGLAVFAPAAPAATQGCTLTSTNGTVTRALGTRTYQLHVPQGLSGTQVPLLLSLHGAGSNGSEDEYFTGWSQFADAQNFIAAYPNARGLPGAGVWDPYSQSSPDVAFVRQVVADISAHWCVDSHRLYVDGWSNGAVMSQRVACDAADTFAAATSYAGGTPTLAGAGVPCNPSRPISVGLIVGQEDFTYLGLAQNTNEWLGYDHCSTTPTQEADVYGTTSTYGCAAATEVFARVVSNTSHNWPFGAQGEDQRQRMWAFFEANPLP